jgi:hypothetical protein
MNALEHIDSLTLEMLSHLYKDVIPHISTSSKIPPLSIKSHIDKFENAWMKRRLREQDEEIEALKEQNEDLKKG